MEDDSQGPQDGKIPAKNDRPEAEAESGEDIAPWVRLDTMVFDIARLIGRQMARADFERLRTAANDNKPRIAEPGGGEGNKD
ncbi:hypothetical protein PV773_18140 [Mesorhizobium sp. CC13]|uniref:hypothetical protein n=1 Tax=Mesorhizobium sp. CC13 TaxID=3029194 RepID=UPI00326671A7